VKFNSMGWTRLLATLMLRAITRPALAVALIRTAWRFRRNGWYTRFPFLPLPSMIYVRWRMHTAYGDHNAVPPVQDIVNYALWAARKH
jgi:hypothetical protein